MHVISTLSARSRIVVRFSTHLPERLIQILPLTKNEAICNLNDWIKKSTIDAGLQYRCGQVGRIIQSPPHPTPCKLTQTDNHYRSIRMSMEDLTTRRCSRYMAALTMAFFNEYLTYTTNDVGTSTRTERKFVKTSIM